MNRAAAVLVTALGLAFGFAASADPPGVPTASDGSVGREHFSPSVPTVEAALDVTACQAGEMAACYELGNRHHGGRGVARDHVAAVAWIRHACDGGHAPACYDLGVRHLLGEYVPQDAQAALARIDAACEGGYGVACYFGATLRRDGVGVARAPAAAADLVRRACELGYGPACAEALADLESVPGGEESALPAGTPELIVARARMCDHGIETACFLLADTWASGESMPVDADRALRLRRGACDWGYLAACAALGADR